ncbi:MAG: hypothetical protein P4L98_06660 [Ancalomicrobiaceae bacterium]|nr:hypothetical protein [Ancalomicrobiaceae bacterium]
MTTKLSPEQSAIDRLIVDEIFDTIPEEWTCFALIVEPRMLDGGGQVVTLINPEVVGAEMEPSTTIRGHVGELVAFLAKEGRTWERLTYQASLDDSGAWRLKITAPLPD